MKVCDDNYYGFDHKAVAKRFSGDLTYLGTTCIRGEYKPVALYRASNPDRSKGHKDVMLLQVETGASGSARGMVRGLNLDEFENKDVVVEGVHCLGCDEFVYSTMRHDCHYCSCGAFAVDGGRDYVRVINNDETKGRPGNLNLLTGKFKFYGGKVSKKQPRAVIYFDADDILVDFRSEFYAKYWPEQSLDYVAEQWGYLEHFTLDAVLAHIAAMPLDNLKPLKGVKRMLKHLRQLNCKIVVVTAVADKYAPARIKNFADIGIKYDEIYCTTASKADLIAVVHKKYENAAGKDIPAFFVDDRLKTCIEVAEKPPTSKTRVICPMFTYNDSLAAKALSLDVLTVTYFLGEPLKDSYKRLFDRVVQTVVEES